MELSIIKPRITKCPSTGMWILNRMGITHRCGPNIDPSEEGFRRWSTAFSQGIALGVQRLTREQQRAEHA